MDKRTADLLAHLGRGGAAGYYWRADLKTSSWYATTRLVNPPADVDCYFGVHPLAQPRGKHQRGTLDTIAAINCLFAEFDAKDFGGDLAAVLRYIETLPIPPTALVCSGGGYHAYWLLSEPVNVTADNRNHLRSVQAAWVSLVGGDPNAKDLARVLRVPGTLNAKYNPPRLVEFVWSDPDYLPLYALEQHLAAYGEIPPSPTTPIELPPATQGDGGPTTGARAKAYGRAALGAELLALQAAQPGRRNAQLNESAFKLGALVAGGLLEQHDVIGGLWHTARGLGTDASFTEAQINATIESGYKAGLKHPRSMPA